MTDSLSLLKIFLVLIILHLVISIITRGRDVLLKPYKIALLVLVASWALDAIIRLAFNATSFVATSIISEIIVAIVITNVFTKEFGVIIPGEFKLKASSYYIVIQFIINLVFLYSVSVLNPRVITAIMAFGFVDFIIVYISLGMIFFKATKKIISNKTTSYSQY